MVRERKAGKPNADAIARTKKLWERLRRKSHVPRDERKKLVEELYSIITGRVKEFVFKHDSVRVIQTALKYANLPQRKAIAKELQGDFRNLAESKYAKFLLGKLLVHGDAEIRDLIIPEFYGHVKRLMRHPEASWILDDIYRTVATTAQKNRLLCEWYGAEFVLFDDVIESQGSAVTLSTILKERPEKRGPIMQYLLELINQLVQKKSTGFTMLHDAMLQYFLNTTPGSTEASDFIELLKGDEEGDLVKNLAFTQSGARLICLVLAYSNAKDRKILLRMYRNTINMMAGDPYAHTILLAAYEVIDDTKLTQKIVFPELFTPDDLLHHVNGQLSRIPVLYLFTGDRTAWLVTDTDREILSEVREIRSQTSKKDSSIRRNELVSAASPALLEFIAGNADSLVESSFGCQFITEVLFEAQGDKSAALNAVVATASSGSKDIQTPAAGRMLKALVQGGRYNPSKKCIEPVQPPLKFHSLLYDSINDDVMSWTTGSNAFVVVALVETEDFSRKKELISALKKNRKTLLDITSNNPSDQGTKKRDPTAAAAKILLEKIAAQ